MFRAGHAAVSRYHTECQRNPSLVPTNAFHPRDIRDCRDGLEDTYLVRMFADFEQTLRDYWQNVRGRKSRPSVSVLVGNIAAYCYVHEDNLARVHEVREYRNALVHGGKLPPKVLLAAARSPLCRFLSHLPLVW